MTVDSQPRIQLVGELKAIGKQPEQVVLTAIERKNADLVTTVTGTTYTVLPADTVIVVDDDTAGGAVTVTLPVAGASEGRRLIIKKLGTTGSVTVDGDSAETIDGATTVVISTQYNRVAIVSDGTEWWRID